MTSLHKPFRALPRSADQRVRVVIAAALFSTASYLCFDYMRDQAMLRSKAFTAVSFKVKSHERVQHVLGLPITLSTNWLAQPRIKGSFAPARGLVDFNFELLGPNGSARTRYTARKTAANQDFITDHFTTTLPDGSILDFKDTDASQITSLGLRERLQARHAQSKK